MIDEIFPIPDLYY